MCRLSWNLGASTSWNPLGLSRPVMGLLYFSFFTKYWVHRVVIILKTEGHKGHNLRNILKTIRSCCRVRRNAICNTENEGKSDRVAIGVDFYTMSAGMAELLSRSGRRWLRAVVLYTVESAVFVLRRILPSRSFEVVRQRYSAVEIEIWIFLSRLL